MKISMMTPMSVAQTDKDGKINPFLQDIEHMGHAIGTNLTAMYMNFPNEECSEIILVNTRTGERIRIEVETKCGVCGKIGHDMVASKRLGGHACKECFKNW